MLLMFITRLKDLCNNLGVFIFTSTQVNGQWKEVRDADQNLLRGAKAIADKVDCGVVALEPTQADLEAIAPIMMGRFDEEPNLVFHVYKNRRGKWNKVKVWCRVDLGTCRIRDMFMTDNDYRLIPIELTEIETYPIEDITEENEVIKNYTF